MPFSKNLRYRFVDFVTKWWFAAIAAILFNPIVNAFETGNLDTIASELQKDLGFSNVSILEGGTQAWRDSGSPTS